MSGLTYEQRERLIAAGLAPFVGPKPREPDYINGWNAPADAWDLHCWEQEAEATERFVAKVVDALAPVVAEILAEATS